MSATEARKQFFTDYHQASTTIEAEDLEQYHAINDQQELLDLLYGNTGIIHPAVADILIRKLMNIQVLEDYAINNPDAHIRRLAAKALSFDRILLFWEGRDWQGAIALMTKLCEGIDEELCDIIPSRLSASITRLSSIEVPYTESLRFFTLSR